MRSSFRDAGLSVEGEYARSVELALLRHELSQPLSHLVTTLGMLRYRLQDASSPNEADRVRDIVDSLCAAELTVRHLCEVANRIGVQRSEKTELVDVADAVSSVVDMVKDAIKAHAALVVDLRRVPHVYANRTELQQIVLHLLWDAVVPSRRDPAVPRHVSVRVLEGGSGKVIILVEDDGACAALRDPHRSGASVDKFHGPTGLRWALCRRLIGAWGGVLLVDRTLALNATVVRILLPAASAD